MSKLYYTSSFIRNRKFDRLEDVVEFIEPSDIILIFDTNVVIEYRKYYHNPVQFTSRIEYLKSLRNLVKTIQNYNLEVNASFGVEESCRETLDFSLNLSKLKQTQQAVIDMFYTDYAAFDKHLTQRQYFGDEIKLKNEYISSKLNCLKQKSTFQHLLVVSYLVMLKTVELYYKIQFNEVDKIQAFKLLLDFMRDEIDANLGMSANYAIHLFGGGKGFKSLWKKKGSSIEKKLHNIFNASIDIICPVIANKTQQMFGEIGERKLTPVFVTGDKVLSDLHSLQVTNFIFSNNPYINEKSFTPEGTIYDIKYELLNWSEEEYEIINSWNGEMNLLTARKTFNKSKDTLHLLPLVKPLEEKVISILETFSKPVDSVDKKVKVSNVISL